MDSIGAMPDGEAPLIENLIASEAGLRNRTGGLEFAVLAAAGPRDDVKTIVPYHGDTAADDKLFAMGRRTGSANIWDVTPGGTIASALVNFTTTTGNAGIGQSIQFATTGDRFLAYCDEENGLYYWRESTAAWTKIAVGVRQPWRPSTAYVIGNTVANGGNTYVCDTNGVSAASGGPTGTGTNIADGSTQWDYNGVAESTTAIGPSLADQNLGYTADPANFVYAATWKGRNFFIEKSTSRCWFLDPSSAYGTATSFDFGPQFRAGGHLLSLHTWSRDGGDGMDTLLVALSTGGDLVIYQGTSPASASTFALRGVWSVGQLPRFGRRFAVEHGGELYVVSTLGVFPASMLLAGADPKAYRIPEQRIANTIRAEVLAHPGTTIPLQLTVHPTDNALLFINPQSATQYAFSFNSKTWSKYTTTNLAMYCAAAWKGEMYWGDGSETGRVCRATGNGDPASIGDPTPADIRWNVVTRSESMGTPNQKRVTAIIPRVHTPDGDGAPGLSASARHTFDGSSPNNSLESSASALKEHTKMLGATGLGRSASLVVSGASKVETILVDIGVMFEQGGVL